MIYWDGLMGWSKTWRISDTQEHKARMEDGNVQV